MSSRISALPPVAAPRTLSRALDRHPAVVMIVPALLVIGVVVIYPLVYAVWTSFHGARLGDLSGGGLTLERYSEVFGDPRFWHSMGVSVLFLVCVVSIELVLGLALALLFSQPAPGMSVLRGILVLPVLMSPVIIGLLWKLVLNEQFGLVNTVLEGVGLPTAPWLSDTGWAKASIVVMDVWQWTPFMALLLAAGLHGLPREVLEAASVDGARPLTRFRTVVLPMLTKVIFISVAFRIVFALSTFASVFVLTQGGPNRATDLFSLFIYREGLQNFNTSYAAAASLVVLVIVLVSFTALFWPALRRWAS